MSAPVKLSIAEWQEIAAAVWEKEIALRRGDYGRSNSDVDIKAWANQLRGIQKKIGVDAQVVIKKGVAPVKG